MQSCQLKEYLFKLGCKIELMVSVAWGGDMEMKYSQDIVLSEDWAQRKKVGSSYVEGR